MRYKSPWYTTLFAEVGVGVALKLALADSATPLDCASSPYTCTSVNVGLVTSSSSAAPNPATIPFVSVVFPLPKSPVSNTSSGAFSPRANSLPHAIVSSADRVTTLFASFAIPPRICSATPLQLPQKFQPRLRHCPRHFARHYPRQIRPPRRPFRRRPMQIHAQRQRPQPIVRLELPRHRRQHARQNIPRPALRQSRIPRRVHQKPSIRRRHNRVRPLQDHMRIPPLRRFRCRLHAIRFHIFHRRTRQPRHLPRMRRNRQKFTLPIAQFIRSPRKRIQS